MIRRILFVILIACFLGGLGYSYLYFKNKKQPVSNTLNAIPSSAAFIIESKNTVTSWGKLSNANIIWSELQSTQYFSDINNTIEALDSIRIQNPQLNELINKQSIFISAHMSGANDFDFLFSISIPNNIEKEQIFELINSKIKPSNTSSKTYDEVTIFTCSFNDTKASYAYYDGIFLISKSMILVEDAIRQINTGTSLLEISDFQKIVHTAGKNIDANFYINYKVLPNVLSTLLKDENTSVIESFSDLANWTEIDLSLKPNAISFNGFTYSNDSINNYMNVFVDQKPQKFEMIDILPKNTACIIRTGFSDFEKFQKRYKTYLEKNNKLFEFGVKLKLLENEYELNAHDDFYSWVDSEIALVISEPKNNDYINQSYAVIKSNDIDFTEEILANLVYKTSGENEAKIDSILYHDFIIRKIEIPTLLPTLFNSVFKPISGNYYTIIEDYVIFGNTSSAIRDFINYYINKKTLDKNAEFEQFYENISEESNLFVYSNISRSTLLYKSFLNNEFSAYVDKYEELYKKFDGVAIQISKDKNNMYYNNVFLHYNPIYKQETSSLWETKLDTTLHCKPQIVINHKTRAKEVVVQDDANNLYLISNTGKILWKKKLNEKIIGDIDQIDIYKNKKLQLLFNTKSKLHLLDRNGNYVDNYPIKFESNATSPISVMDYDNNKNYRILVAFENKKIINYDAEGNIVKGWEFESSKNIIDTKFEHLQFSGKDYIINCDIDGNVYVLNRKGKGRIKIKNKLNSNSTFYLTKKKNINKSYILNADSVGNVYKLTFEDSLELITPIDKLNAISFLSGDMNEDMSKDYIYQTKDKLIAYDENFNLIFDLDFDNALTQQPQLFNTKKNINKIGFTVNNEIHLVNKNGINESGFPLFGTTQFSIGDINNDNTLELIVGGNDGFIYSYTLEE